MTCPSVHGELDFDSALAHSCNGAFASLALELGCRTVAFPAISTGVYHYPLEKATRIAVQTVRRFLAEHPEGPAVTFVCFNEPAKAAYERELK